MGRLFRGVLSPTQREGYRQTLTAFLKSSAHRWVAARVTAAREFVELARLEHSPGPARLREWKDTLNCYFRRGRATLRLIADARSQIADRGGVPPLARTDQGCTPWEATLIAGLRERHLAWRTEQTYRGRMQWFVKWRESKRRGTSNIEHRTPNR